MGMPFEVRLDKLNQFATSLKNTRNPTKVFMSIVSSTRVEKAVFKKQQPDDTKAGEYQTGSH